jgi:hypothetical protein
MGRVAAVMVFVLPFTACGAGSPSPDAAVLASPDAASAPATCRLMLSRGTANVTEADFPIGEQCPGERTDDGMGHPFIDLQPSDVRAGVVRTFSIWQFQTESPAGTVLKVEDGYDEIASRGVSVRYLEFAGTESRTWRADRGTVTLLATRDESYTLQLTRVHMIPERESAGANLAAGECEVNGTVVSILP